MIVIVVRSLSIRVTRMTTPDSITRIFVTKRYLESSRHSSVKPEQLSVKRAKVRSISPVITNSHHGTSTMTTFPELTSPTTIVLLGYLL